MAATTKPPSNYTGEIIKKLRMTRGLIRRELGTMVGVTEHAIRGYETGERLPDLGMMFKLCSYFKLDISFFKVAYEKDLAARSKKAGALEDLKRLEERYAALCEKAKTDITALSMATKVHGEISRLRGKVANKLEYPMKSTPILGDVPQGNPKEPIEEVLDWVATPVRDDIDYILVGNGHSLKDAGIFDGDRLWIRQTNAAEPGDLVIAMVADQVTAKYFVEVAGKYYLMAANDEYYDIPFDPEQDRILGVVKRIEKRPPPAPRKAPRLEQV